MRFVCVLAALCALAVPAAAQTTQPATPTSVDILVLPATGDPLTVAPLGTRNTVISATASVCNLAASAAPTTPLINPTSAEFADPFTAGRVCKVPMPTGLPNGADYRAVAVFNAPACDVTPCRSPRSAVGVPSFTVAPILTIPVTPTNLAIRQ